MGDKTAIAANGDDRRPPISAYIRTLNEADRILPVIEAALQVAREVVVVDSGSTDGTTDVAAAAGARVIHNPWPGNGFQKRVAENACGNDWLLDLDADEVLNVELILAIQTLFANGPPGGSVYQLEMVSAPPVGEPWYGFMLTYRNKLYDRRSHRMPESKAWDQLELPKSLNPKRLDGSIIHYSFRDFSDITHKYNRISTTRAQSTKPRSLMQLRLRVWFGLPVYMFKFLIIRSYIRAGTYGFALATIAAHARWLRDAKMYEMALKARSAK